VLQAHPIPRSNHDRTVRLRLTREAVVVEYQLEVDPYTVVFEDLPAVLSQEELARLSKPEEFYTAFTRSYAPILADNLLARLDGKPLTFTCRKQGHELLDHLRCHFVFEAAWQLTPESRHELTFREGNYELEEGLLRLSLTSEAPLTQWSKTVPDEALQTRPAFELRPGDSARLRQAAATISLPAPPVVKPVVQPEPETVPAPGFEAAPNLAAVIVVTMLAVVWILWRRLRGFARKASG
jgi:hypothetical protein